MKLPIRPGYEPAEARQESALPAGDRWQFEPKWDGFRCLAFKDGERVDLRSKSSKPLDRYFPEIFAKDRSDFDQLLERIHPAQSRVQTLSREHPARFIVFDLLADSPDSDLYERPLAKRRAKLEALAKKFAKGGLIELSPATRDRAQAQRWLRTHGARDGVMAKLLDEPYRSGQRDAMVKIKRRRTADCVVGGFRYASSSKLVGSLLLGLYDRTGKLHHVGFMSGIRDTERRALTARLEKLIQPPGFTGNAPGGPSRWSTERSEQWEPLKPSLVVEVEFDHVTGDRFRHGTRLVRWRPDKKPRQCTMAQLRA